jgi:hypothetical protein
MKMKVKYISYLLLLFVLFSCAKPNVYKSKGVFYFEKPAKELTSYTALQYPPDHNMSNGSTILVDSSLVMATLSSKTEGREAYSTIYSFNIKNHNIQDSLIIKS